MKQFFSMFNQVMANGILVYLAFSYREIDILNLIFMSYLSLFSLTAFYHNRDRV